MKNVLVIQGARFGDLIQSKRLVLSLQRQCHVHLAVDQSLLPLAALLYPRTSLHGFFFHGKPNPEKLKHNTSGMASLREQDFNHVYTCNFSRLTITLARLFALDRVSGYRPAHVSDGGLLRSPWARLAFRLATMRSQSPLNLVDFWANFAPNPIVPDMVNPQARGGGKGIGIAVAGREERRSIPLPALVQIAQALFQLLKAPEIRLFGTEAESRRSKKLQRLFSTPMLTRTVDLCGRTDWPGLVEQMTGLDCLITPDTGLMHLAAHLGVPTLACFLSSAWLHETGPYGIGHKILQATPPCAPCLETAPCERDFLCYTPWQQNMGRITAQIYTGNVDGRWPENLQLWTTALDSLGAAPRLLAGSDPALLRRNILRNIIQNKLGLEPMGEEHMEERQHLLRELDTVADFMLPPWRYC